MLTVIGLSGSLITLKAFDLKTNTFHPEYYLDLESKESPLDYFDYCFEGFATKVEHVSQYNGFGTDIPYTYFRVKVTKEIKGDVEKEVLIKYYGGYNEAGELELMNDATMPELGEIYTFYCNRTTLTYKDDGRTIDGSYVINHPSCIVKGSAEQSKSPVQTPGSKEKAVLKDVTVTNFNLRDNLQMAALFTNLIPTRDEFENASIISLNYTFTFALKNGNYRIFKIKRDTLDYLAIYSTGTYDVEVYVYDDYYALLTSNDNVPAGSRGTLYTSGVNFYCNFYADKDRYYYFQVVPKSTVTGSTTIRCIVDNYYVSPYSYLVWDKNAVKNGKITFKDHTDYDYYVLIGAAEWNKLGAVEIKIGSNPNLNIYQYSDSDGFVAYTTKHWLKGWQIWLNHYYFQNLTFSQKLKTSMHEFGHTLGLDEFSGSGYSESSDNVMVQGVRDLYRLGPADIAVYRQKWGY